MRGAIPTLSNMSKCVVLNQVQDFIFNLNWKMPECIPWSEGEENDDDGTQEHERTEEIVAVACTNVT
jgi:hypothetical protein